MLDLKTLKVLMVSPCNTFTLDEYKEYKKLYDKTVNENRVTYLGCKGVCLVSKEVDYDSHICRCHTCGITVRQATDEFKIATSWTAINKEVDKWAESSPAEKLKFKMSDEVARKVITRVYKEIQNCKDEKKEFPEIPLPYATLSKSSKVNDWEDLDFKERAWERHKQFLSTYDCPPPKKWNTLSIAEKKQVWVRYKGWLSAAIAKWREVHPRPVSHRQFTCPPPSRQPSRQPKPTQSYTRPPPSPAQLPVLPEPAFVHPLFQVRSRTSIALSAPIQVRSGYS